MRRTHLYCITFYFGFASAIAQVLLIREMLTIFRGNEFIIGIIFAAWFLGVFAGARFNPERDTAHHERQLRIILLVFPLTLPIFIYLPHLIAIVFPPAPGVFYSFSTECLIAFLISLPVSFPVGYFFPPAVNLAQYDIAPGGRIYAIESFGAFTGGAAFSFIFVDMLNPLGITALLTLISLALYFSMTGSKYLRVLLIAPIACLFASDGIEQAFFTQLWNTTHRSALVRYARTKHQTIFIESLSGQIHIYGNGVFYYALPDKYGARPLFHLIQALRQKPGSRICMLGGAPGTLAHNLAVTDFNDVQYCEYDAGLWRRVLTKLKDMYPDDYTGGGIRVILRDYVEYLLKADEKFDIILSMPPPPENAMLNRYYTREFFTLCASRLSEQGIFICGIQGPANYLSPERARYLASIYKSFSSVYPYMLSTSGDPGYLIGAQTPHIIPTTPEALIHRYADDYPRRNFSRVENELTGNFSPLELHMLFESSQRTYIDATVSPLLANIDENSELSPGLYLRYFLLSAFQENSLWYYCMQYPHIPASFAMLIFIAMILRVRYRLGALQMHAGIVIAVTGFVSISMVILLIMLYQSFYGLVYYRISLINAVFMLGLTAGSVVAVRMSMLRTWKSFAVFIISAGCVLIFTVTRLEGIFWFSLFLFAAAAGTVFPSLFLRLSDQSAHITASNIDAMDYLGSIAGALFTSMLLIPRLGIRGVLMVFAGITLLTMIYILLHSTRRST